MTTYTVRLSLEGKDLVEDFSQAYAELILQPIGSREAYLAYERLCLRKRELFEYIGKLERTQRVRQESHTITPLVDR